MAQPDWRSMSNQLKRGITDGKVKNMRPDSANADYTSSIERSKQLHPIYYGTFGSPNDAARDEDLPDYEVRRLLRETGLEY